MTKPQAVTDITRALIDQILAEWRDVIGADYDAYRNHVQRMVAVCCALLACDAEAQEKLAIAGAFHDIGIWTENTLDYLDPSVVPARDYLQKRGLSQWEHEISLMITEHHRVRPVADKRFPLVELFRQGDLVDFSLGLFRFGLPKSTLAELKSSYPNVGFHKRLMQLGWRWFLRHPLNPLPMFKW